MVSIVKSFKTLYIEISGVCNGKCSYCLSGRYKVHGGKFIDVDLFEKILRRLTEQGLIDRRTSVGLYNWGEPFLHPHLSEIIQIVNKFKISYVFSTNASIVPKIDHQFVQGLDRIIFSMPGFSQNAYDRIHGFNFDKICSNIEKIVTDSRSAGFKGIFQISYHVYQFNMDEIVPCETFARKNGIEFTPQFAILNHWDHIWSYVDNKLSYEMLKEISQDLFCYKLHDFAADSLGSYRCPQYDLLAIDENANVLLCCQVPKSHQYYAGNILHDDIDTILQRRESNIVCSQCIERGMARYINTSLHFPTFGKPRLIPFRQVLMKIYRHIMCRISKDTA